MSKEIIFLGGCDEIGANSMYLYIDGTGIIIDAGLHPKKRDKNAFPLLEFIGDNPTDFLVLTHAHTDHIGSIPYLLKQHPHLKIFASEPTRDLIPIMLRDIAKLIKNDTVEILPQNALSLYDSETLQRIVMLVEGIKFNQGYPMRGRFGKSDITITLFNSGHILGSSSVLVQSDKFSILHTGDINFSNQALLKGADLPTHHLDVLVTECTNGGETEIPSYKAEQKRLAGFINEIAGGNGSILIPTFALGKTQEVLMILRNLIRKASIPKLPIYTGGMASRISKVYDNYCYTVPFTKPGFEISDIEVQPFDYRRLLSDKYFHESSIVIAQSGMLNPKTISYRLAERWMQIPNNGIALVGYQDQETPGYALQNSEKDQEFSFGERKFRRKCSVDKFRFSSHSKIEDIIGYIDKTSADLVYIVHGDENASTNMAYNVSKLCEKSNPVIPVIGKKYQI